MVLEKVVIMKNCELLKGIDALNVRVWHAPYIAQGVLFENIGITGWWNICGEDMAFHVRKCGSYYAVFTQDMDDNIELAILRKGESYIDLADKRSRHIDLGEQYIISEYVDDYNRDFTEEFNSIIDKYIKSIASCDYDFSQEIKDFNFYEMFGSVLDTRFFDWNTNANKAIKALYSKMA